MTSSKADPFGWVGHTIDGKFRVEEVVGEGGFGVVYRANHLGLGEQVAVKCLKIPNNLPDADRERFHQSFLEEGRLLRKLSRTTAAVVQALDVGAAASPSGAWTPYLVLEWLKGETLEDHVRARKQAGKTRLSLDEAFALLEPAAIALATAHEEGIAHRDVKPANLFLANVSGLSADEGSVTTLKVLDFGIAKVIAENATLTRALEQTGQTPSMFTPYYGAPEQFNRRFGATGPWTDVYALSLVMVELLSGKNPLEGDDVTQLYIATTDPTLRPTPRARGVRTSQAVEGVFQKALNIEPRGRYKTAREFWEALREALPAAIEEDAPGDPLPSTIPSSGALHDLRTTSPQINSGAVKPASSRRGLLAAAFAVVFVALAFFASYALKKRAEAGEFVPASHFTAELGHVEMPLVPVDMVLVPAASFTMGHEKEGRTEKPAHKVVISRGFYLDRMEVTAGDYAKCVAAKKCTGTNVHGPDVGESEAQKWAPFCTGLDGTKARHPINCVDRAQAANYCAFVGKRLPTEAEWEYAARGTDERLYPWGNDAPTCTMANLSRNKGECAGRPQGTMEVGSFPDAKSPFGALDLIGNVWEWVADEWDPDVYKQPNQKDPLVKKGEKGVLRGASWDYSASVAKATFRLSFDKTRGHVSTGMRCARSAD